MRYRPSDRALRRSSRPSLRSPHQRSRSGKGQITRQVDFHLETVSPRRFADTSSQLPASASRPERPQTAAIMISAGSLSTAGSTLCEVEYDDWNTEGVAEAFMPPLLPPFQQSKRWPGRRKPVPRRSKSEETVLDDIYFQIQPATPPATLREEHDEADETLEVQHAASEVASTTVTDGNCGLPNSTALLGLRHRQCVRASLAWQRWKNRRSNDRQLEDVASDPAARLGKSSRIRRKLSRSLRAMTRARPSRSTGRVRHFVRFSRRLGSMSTVPPASDLTSPKNMAARLSRSLIPDGDTCEFEQEMNKEYPKIKEKHFGSYIRASPKKDKQRNPTGIGEETILQNIPPVPRKSIDVIEWKQQQIIRSVTDQDGSPAPRVDDSRTEQQDSRATNSRPTLSPPPRTSSRTATDPDLLSGPSEASVVSMTRLAPALRSARSLRSKPGSANLRTRKRSFGLPASPSPRIRAAASTDTLARIEAQAGIDDMLSAHANQSSPSRSLSALKASQSPGKPPERPLPDLPFEPQYGRLDTASRASQRSLRSSKDSAVTEAYQSMIRNANGRLSPADELTPLPLAPHVHLSPRRHSKRQSTNSVNGKISVYPDPPSPTSVYSLDSQLSGHAFVPTTRINSVGRNKHVRALKSRDLRLANQASISEEDEENFTDIAEKFPPAPASRGSSRSRKGHMREHSAGLSLRSRRRNAVQPRPAVPKQTLTLSKIMTIVNTDPVTDTFRAASPTHGVHAEVTTARISHLVGPRSSKSGLRSGRQTPVGGTILPMPKPSLAPQTPPLTASSSEDADAENEDFPEDGLLPLTSISTGTNIRRPTQATLLSPHNISAKRQPLPSSSSAPNLSLYQKPTASSSSLFSSTRRSHNLKPTHNVPSAPTSQISELLTAFHALRGENEALRRSHQHLERKLTQIEQARYRQGNEENRRLQRSYEATGRERLLPPATGVVMNDTGAATGTLRAPTGYIIAGGYSRPTSQISGTGAVRGSIIEETHPDPFDDSRAPGTAERTETGADRGSPLLEATTLGMDTWLDVFNPPAQFLGHHELWAVPARTPEPTPSSAAARMSSMLPNRPSSSIQDRHSLLLPPNTYRPTPTITRQHGPTHPAPRIDLEHGPPLHHHHHDHPHSLTTHDLAAIKPGRSSFLLDAEIDFARVAVGEGVVRERELPLALRAGPGAVERRLGAFVEG